MYTSVAMAKDIVQKQIIQSGRLQTMDTKHGHGVCADVSPFVVAFSPSPSSSITDNSPDQESSDEPFMELSSIMKHLPSPRKGLSKYFSGKSQSFTSLCDVICLKDLAKKKTQCTREKMKKKHGETRLGHGCRGKAIEKKRRAGALSLH